MLTEGARIEWRANWKLVLTSSVGFLFFSIMTASLSMFMLPLSTEFDWSRTLISSGVTLAAGVAALLSPFVGVLIDRYGARRIAMPGLVANILAISAFSLANGSSIQWLGLWFVYAVVSISVKTTVWASAISGVFFESRGLALGVTLAGTAAAQMVMPPLTGWLISDFGWRFAYVGLGLGFGLLTFVLCYFFLYDAGDARRRSGVAQVMSPPKPVYTGLTIGHALRDTALWRIGIATFVMFTFGVGLMIHQIAILSDAGVTMAHAAWLASFAGLVGVAGKLVSGVLLDRLRGGLVGGVTIGVAAFAFAFLVGAKSVPLIILAMAVNGYVTGAKLQIASYLTLRYCGLRNMGAIYGTLMSFVALATGIGPVLAGMIYDVTGSYDAFLIGGVVASLSSGLLLLTLPRYPEFA